MEATLHTNHGDVRVTLFPDHAPKTVKNFTGPTRSISLPLPVR